MSKLHDIKGYSASSYSSNDRYSWEGNILLEDDGWFEGVVKCPDGISYVDDHFVFGVYYPGKTIMLYKWTPTSIGYPKMFHGLMCDDEYRGECQSFHTFPSFIIIPMGVSSIITEDAEKVRNVTDEEINGVKARIDRYKAVLMDDIGRKDYNDHLDLRSLSCKTILRNYEKKVSTQEESHSTMDECGPVNDGAEETARQYVKLRPSADGNNELPF